MSIIFILGRRNIIARGKDFAETYFELCQEVRRNLEIDYIWHSNRLELSKLPKYANTTLLTSAQGINKCKQKKRFRYQDLVAAQNHVPALKYIRHLASIPDYKISGADILRLHGMVAKDLIPDAGQFRDHDVVITGANFIPPSFRDLPVKMEGLVNYMNRKGLEAIDQSTGTLHLSQFLHPFSDYNGRLGRILMNLVLLKNRYPLTIIDS